MYNIIVYPISLFVNKKRANTEKTKSFFTKFDIYILYFIIFLFILNPE